MDMTMAQKPIKVILKSEWIYKYPAHILVRFMIVCITRLMCLDLH